MTFDISSLFIILMTIIPGYLGEKIFSLFTGNYWREKDWEKTIRILIFSILGFIIYFYISIYFRLPKPLMFQLIFVPSNIFDYDFLSFLYSYILHWFFCAFVGLIFGLITLLIGRLRPTLFYATSWDVFVRTHLQKKWIVVTLTNNNVFCGYFSSCDLSVSPEERDIILESPYKYVERKYKYEKLPYSSIFIQSKIIFSIAIIDELNLDVEETTLLN